MTSSSIKYAAAGTLALLLVAMLTTQLRAEDGVVEISGVIKSIQGNRLAVQASEGSWIVVVDGEALREAKQHTELEFHGRGRASLVERGWWVRLFADVDATGKVVGPLRQLTWFTPQRNQQEGAFPAEPRDEGGEPIVEWDRPQRGELVAGHYLIVGSVRSARGGQMLVVYLDGEKERQVLAQLAPDVDIEIHLTHPKVAGAMFKPGDAVEVRGRAHERQIQALSIVARREEAMGKPLAIQPPPRRPEPTPKPDDDNNPLAGDPAPADSEKPARARILKVN